MYGKEGFELKCKEIKAGKVKWTVSPWTAIDFDMIKINSDLSVSFIFAFNSFKVILIINL
jgi:hypothetical protein